MAENPISISLLNDFVFCPASIYFHGLEQDAEKIVSQDTFQINGTAVHKSVDNGTYSSKKNVLQSLFVYCERYNLYGKIDVFYVDSGILIERKKKISTVYDGYVFQLYAQYFALTEMGYDVKVLRLYSYDDNKTYSVDLPRENSILFQKFEQIIQGISSFSFERFYQINQLKCEHCIYEPLCFYSELKE